MLITVDISNNRSIGGIKFRVLDQRCRFFYMYSRGPSLAGHTHNSRGNPTAGGPRQNLTPGRDATQPYFRKQPSPA
jgi:hypothetical protein